MSPFSIRPSQRGDVKILGAVAGPSGGGKTLSGLRVARGLAGDGKIVVVDTEHGRSQIYADVAQPWDWLDFEPPFSPERYIEALEAAEALSPAVIMVDSISHEYEGEGGLFDLVEEFLEQRAGSDARKRSALSFSAWDYAKRRHKKLVLHLLRMPCHVILGMRAQDKIDLVKEGGQLKAIPKKSLTGLDGWEPICERRLPYEMTCSFLLLPDKPGIPRPLKPMPPTMAPLIPLDRPLDEEAGAALAKWAAGDNAPAGEHDERIKELVDEMLACADTLGNRASVTQAIARNRRVHAAAPEEHVEWLEGQLSRLADAAAAREQEQIEIPTEEGAPA